MPFNCWCNKCQHLIGKGVRFNAEKKQIGMYYSTRIWSFSMRCPSCSNGIEVVTDPKNTEYVVKTGGRRKVGASTIPRLSCHHRRGTSHSSCGNWISCGASVHMQSGKRKMQTILSHILFCRE